MRKQITRALLGFATLFVPAAAAHAQTARAVAVQVPFDFAAGQKRLAAGRYIVRRVGSDTGSTLLIQSADARSAAVVFTGEGESSPQSAQLVFRRRGESYFLASASVPGAASMREVPESRAEKKLAEELGRRAKSGAPDDGAVKTVAVAGEVRQ